MRSPTFVYRRRFLGYRPQDVAQTFEELEPRHTAALGTLRRELVDVHARRAQLAQELLATEERLGRAYDDLYRNMLLTMQVTSAPNQALADAAARHSSQLQAMADLLQNQRAVLARLQAIATGFGDELQRAVTAARQALADTDTPLVIMPHTTPAPTTRPAGGPLVRATARTGGHAP